MTAPTLTAAEVAELRGLIAKATPGPWEAVEDECDGREEAYCHWHRIGPISLMGKTLHDDSRALLALRNHAESLLAAADENARLREALEQMPCYCHRAGDEAERDGDLVILYKHDFTCRRCAALAATPAPEQGDGRTQEIADANAAIKKLQKELDRKGG